MVLIFSAFISILPWVGTHSVYVLFLLQHDSIDYRRYMFYNDAMLSLACIFFFLQYHLENRWLLEEL